MRKHPIEFPVALIAMVVIIIGTVFMLAGPSSATKPTPEHKVVICHATPPDTAANGWHAIEVDVASVGYQHSGHQDQHDADIIPPYSYGQFSYAGKNWDQLGQTIWSNGCQAPTPTTTSTSVSTSTVEPTTSSSTTTLPDSSSTTSTSTSTSTSVVSSTTSTVPEVVTTSTVEPTTTTTSAPSSTTTSTEPETTTSTTTPSGPTTPTEPSSTSSLPTPSSSTPESATPPSTKPSPVISTPTLLAAPTLPRTGSDSDWLFAAGLLLFGFGLLLLMFYPPRRFRR